MCLLRGEERREKLGGREREAHQEHRNHACDTGRVKAQRLVEGRCILWQVEGTAHTHRVVGGRKTEAPTACTHTRHACTEKAT